MTQRSWLYPFPADALCSLWEVMEEIPDHRFLIDYEGSQWLVVDVADPIAALYIQLALGVARPDFSGMPLLESGEVLLTADLRVECERLLTEACASTAHWSQLVHIFTETDAAHRAFGAAYTAITGKPNGAA